MNAAHRFIGGKKRNHLMRVEAGSIPAREGCSNNPRLHPGILRPRAWPTVNIHSRAPGCSGLCLPPASHLHQRHRHYYSGHTQQCLQRTPTSRYYRHLPYPPTNASLSEAPPTRRSSASAQHLDCRSPRRPHCIHFSAGPFLVRSKISFNWASLKPSCIAHVAPAAQAARRVAFHPVANRDRITGDALPAITASSSSRESSGSAEPPSERTSRAYCAIVLNRFATTPSFPPGARWRPHRPDLHPQVPFAMLAGV